MWSDPAFMRSIVAIRGFARRRDLRGGCPDTFDHAMAGKPVVLSEPEFRIEPWAGEDLPPLEKRMGDPAMTENLGGPESPKKIVERQKRYERLAGTGKGRMFK